MRQAVLSTLHTLTCSIPMTILRDKLHSYAHFTDEETKAKRGCSRGCSCSSRVHPPHPACLLRHLPGPFPTNPFHMAPPPQSSHSLSTGNTSSGKPSWDPGGRPSPPSWSLSFQEPKACLSQPSPHSALPETAVPSCGATQHYNLPNIYEHLLCVSHEAGDARDDNSRQALALENLQARGKRIDQVVSLRNLSSQS